MKSLDFEVEQSEVFDKIGESKLMSLATSSRNSPTVRIVSIVIYDQRMFFQTGMDLQKYSQICENQNIALCFDNMQIEGIANIVGMPLDNENIMQIYEKHYKSAFERYSRLDKEVLIEIIPKKITKWEYDDNGKPYRIFIEMDSKKAYKEMYLR